MRLSKTDTNLHRGGQCGAWLMDCVYCLKACVMARRRADYLQFRRRVKDTEAGTDGHRWVSVRRQNLGAELLLVGMPGGRLHEGGC